MRLEPAIDWKHEDQVLTGDLPVRAEVDKVPCGVVCNTGLPQWLWVVDTLGFDPIWCLMGKEMELDWLRVVYPKIVFTCDMQYCPEVPAMFCDGRPLLSFNWATLQLLFSVRRTRRSLTGWQQLHASLSHSAVGGCSDASTHVFCMVRSSPVLSNRENLPYLPSCVYAVASDTVDAGRVAVPPLSRRLPHSTVVPLSTTLYHGGGLFPSGLKTSPVFLLPSVLSPTGWCRRRLTLAETWGVYDVPHRIVELLPNMPSVAAAWHASRTLLPGRGLEHGVRQLLAQLEGRVEGE